ncbi:Integral membrane protein of the Golgi [Coemansia nantahalensis]|nr:Integral membrane protein of the Golgi [Coemansia nantahalensis]
MVERSRLCVDFSLTFFAVHLILVWWHQGTPPLALPWWLAVAASGALMAVGGRAACLRRELLPIAIRSYMPVRAPEVGPDHGGPGGAEEHELETRHADPGPAHADARRPLPPPPPATEVLFDASPPRASTSASDGWSNDDWGVADDDTAARPSAPRQPPARSATPLAAPKGGKTD